MYADIIFINGEVITVDGNESVQEAVAVKDNQIVGVGKTVEMNGWIGEETRVIDLDGKSLLPGFIDAHSHLTIFGTNLLGINCQDSHIQSLQDLYAELKRR